MRVFLDTNVLVSAVATRGLCADVLRVVLVEHRLVVGGAVLSELRRVLRDKLKIPPTVVEETEALLRREATVVLDRAQLSVKLRDADDLPVLAEAVAGEVDVLVTGDGELNSLGRAAPVVVLTPRAFWDLLRQSGGPEPAS